MNIADYKVKKFIFATQIINLNNHIMKRLQLIINIILAVAVIALFVLYFTGIGKPEGSIPESGVISGTVKNSNIYYIQLDSVLDKYEMAINYADELQKKFNSSEAELQSRQSEYEKEISDYQYKVQRGLITRADAQNIEETLYAKQQDLVYLQQQLSNEINEQNVVMNNQVTNSITEFLKKYYADKNYQFILGTTFGGTVLYANDSLDISDEVIEGLNKEYQAAQE